MRRRELEVTDPEEIRQILDRCRILSLGLSDGEQSYVLPMNYGYEMGEDGSLTLYLHGAREGYKYEIMEKNPKVSFSMFTDVVPFSNEKPCQYGNAYRSILGRGVIAMVTDPAEKMAALTTFMATQTGKHFDFNEGLVSTVNVMRISVTEYTAKNRPLPERIARKMQ